MEKKQKILIAFIILFVVMIISIIITLLFLSKNNQNNIGNNHVSQDVIENEMNNTYIEEINDDIEETPEEETNKTVNYVEDRTNYFTINAITENYINSIGMEDKERLKAILSPEYISRYKITDSNLFNILTVPKLTTEKQYYKFTATEMLTAQIDNATDLYFVKGKCRIVGKDTKFSIQVMVELDTSNKLYYLYPYQYIKDNGFGSLKAGSKLNNYQKEEISNRQYNQFAYIQVDDREMANKYFNHYNELLMYYPDDAYNQLNAEYSQKRFGSEANFKEYLKENVKTIYSMRIDQYKIVSNGDSVDYICTDKYNNIYIFRQQGGIMHYNVFLDNYTIMTEEEINSYNKLDKFDKAKYNITKFINMVNTKDYKGINNILDETFRKNNFASIELLKQSIQKNMYQLNSIEIESYDDETYAYYVFNCQITNMNNTKDTKKMTIIINQSDGTDFTMSYSF